MANGLYSFARERFGGANINLTADTIQAILCSAGYTPSLTGDKHLADIPGGARVATATMGTKSETNGVFRAANTIWVAVPAGSTVTQCVIYDLTADVLLFLITLATGLPITTDGSNIQSSWDTGANGIFVI